MAARGIDAAQRDLERSDRGTSAEAFREALGAADDRRKLIEAKEQPPADGEVWIDEGVVDESRDARKRPAKRRARGSRGRRKGSAAPRLDAEADDGLAAAGLIEGLPDRPTGMAVDEMDDKARVALGRASDAFADDRIPDARQIINKLVREWPDVAEVRELKGLINYRESQWKTAIVHLEAFARLAASAERHPVLADCYRALGRHDRVEALWADLGAASPAADIVAEGRIVYAGSLADQGRFTEAIDVVRAGLRTKSARSSRPRDHVLRLRYVLADLLDKAGDTPGARAEFETIYDADKRFADVAERLSSLG